VGRWSGLLQLVRMLRRALVASFALALASVLAPAGAYAQARAPKDPSAALGVAEAYAHDLTVQVVAYVEADQRAKLAAYLVAITPPSIPVDTGLWQRLHACEQPDSWYANGYFGNGLHGAGGLGMSDDAWRMGVSAAAARGVTLPSSALAASPDQQMEGAQAFMDAYGWAWACHV